MLSSFALAAAICFAAGTIVVVALAGRAAADGGIARIQYDTEHPRRTR